MEGVQLDAIKGHKITVLLREEKCDPCGAAWLYKKSIVALLLVIGGIIGFLVYGGQRKRATGPNSQRTLRQCEEGNPSSLRYLATVRRAKCNPCAASLPASVSSL